jgi:multiple sugar transport system permease protein
VAIPGQIYEAAERQTAPLPGGGVEAFGAAVFMPCLVPTSLLFLVRIHVINFLDKFFHIRDTYWSLVIACPTLFIPFVAWLLMGYFHTVLVEVVEWAYLDGCGRLGTLLTIVLPVALPGVVCAILCGFTLCWNELLYSLVCMQDELHKTLSVGVITELMWGDMYSWGSLIAACVMGALPIIVLYAFFMDYYAPGLTAGAIK